RNAERLRRGELGIEARLDLHGMTQEEAHRALDDFLACAQHAGRRCVLVITGKGGAGRGGILRSAVPRWLNEAPNRARLLAFAAAQPKHGGAGALYLLLRRRR
ncbi:MAG TPA: Smr/MutS family protein, partial [Stellaceae bacterium]